GLPRAHLGDDSHRIRLTKPRNRAGNSDFLGRERLAEQFADDRRNRITRCVKSWETRQNAVSDFDRELPQILLECCDSHGNDSKKGEADPRPCRSVYGGGIWI